MLSARARSASSPSRGASCSALKHRGRSAPKPPGGKRGSPVTNWKSRARASASIETSASKKAASRREAAAALTPSLGSSTVWARHAARSSSATPSKSEPSSVPLSRACRIAASGTTLHTPRSSAAASRRSTPHSRCSEKRPMYSCRLSAVTRRAAPPAHSGVAVPAPASPPSLPLQSSSSSATK
eukprot:scaffold10934_cov71-Phaeocystis_antarctica.AAC.2